MTARVTNALRDRAAALAAGRPGRTLAATLGAAAVLAGTAGTASAATTSHPASQPAATTAAPAGLAAGHAPATPLDTPAAMTGTGTTPAGTGTGAAAPAATPAGHAAAAVSHAAATAGRPYQMYDSVTPTAMPGHDAAAAYADGPYAEHPAQVTGHPSVLWIDTNGTDPHAAALDVEPGDATPQSAATWAWQRLHTGDGKTAIIYTMRSEWAAARTAVNARLGTQASRVRWWIADPTGTPHNVPGAQATQWYWGQNYDISTVTPALTTS